MAGTKKLYDNSQDSAQDGENQVMTKLVIIMASVHSVQTRLTDHIVSTEVQLHQQQDSMPPALGNPDAKWETTATTNIGVDVAVFKNTLTLTLDVWQRKTKDMLFARCYSPGCR